MPLISLYRYEAGERKEALYRAYHRQAAKYFERSKEPDRFNCLSVVDDGSPSVFSGGKEVTQLMSEVESLILEALQNNDKAVINHFKEVLVICKMCLWQESTTVIEFSPSGVPVEAYPSSLPEQYRFSLPDSI